MRFLAPQKIETIVHFRFGESGHVIGSILQAQGGKLYMPYMFGQMISSTF